MENKEFKFTSLYLTLGIFASILILTGMLLPVFFEKIQIEISVTLLKIMQFAFIISGIMDFGLLFYAKKKLS